MADKTLADRLDDAAGKFAADYGYNVATDYGYNVATDLKEAARILREVSNIADGRDSLDGFLRSKDEKQRRLSEIKRVVTGAAR